MSSEVQYYMEDIWGHKVCPRYFASRSADVHRVWAQDIASDVGWVGTTANEGPVCQVKEAPTTQLQVMFGCT